MTAIAAFVILSTLQGTPTRTLSSRFPGETAGYKPVGAADCSSMDMAGMPRMNTCERRYSNGSLTVTISLIEYPGGNPALAPGAQGDDPSGADAVMERLSVGAARGTVTWMKSSHVATASLSVGKTLQADVSGPNQPNGEAVKALARAIAF